MAVTIVLVVVGPATTVFGQARGAFQVGGFNIPGYDPQFGFNVFRAYSFGGSNRGGRGTPVGILASRIAGQASLERPRPYVGGYSSAVGATVPALAMPTQRVLYRPMVMDIASAAVGRAPRMARNIQQVAAGMALVEEFASPPSILASATKAVTSFVPPEKGRYEICMRNGETGMRAGDYQKAVDWFALAGQIAKQSPEAHLSLMHANIVLGNYSVSAYHLRQAVYFLPKLPGKAIDLASFFRQAVDQDDTRFTKLLDTLRGKAERIKGDPNLWLSLAYLQWYAGHVDEGAASLRKAIHTSKDPLLTEAVESFWVGGMASGRIRDTLTPLDPGSPSSHASAKPSGGRAEAQDPQTGT